MAGGGTGWFLRFLPTQTVLGFCDTSFNPWTFNTTITVTWVSLHMYFNWHNLNWTTSLWESSTYLRIHQFYSFPRNEQKVSPDVGIQMGCEHMGQTEKIQSKVFLTIQTWLAHLDTSKYVRCTLASHTAKEKIPGFTGVLPSSYDLMTSIFKILNKRKKLFYLLFFYVDGKFTDSSKTKINNSKICFLDRAAIFKENGFVFVYFRGIQTGEVLQWQWLFSVTF